MTPDAVFTRDGDAFVPSIHARGPWDAGSLHGGAPTALLARTIEALETPAPMRCVRLAVEFPRAVPLEPVLASARLTRPGASLALAEARLTTLDGTEVLRANATLLRRGNVELPAAAMIPELEPIPGPDDGRVDRAARRRRDRGLSPQRHRAALRPRRLGPGPALGWFRLKMPMVAGRSRRRCSARSRSPTSATASVAPWTSASTSSSSTDLTVHLHREAGGRMGLAGLAPTSTAPASANPRRSCATDKAASASPRSRSSSTHAGRPAPTCRARVHTTHRSTRT